MDQGKLTIYMQKSNPFLPVHENHIHALSTPST